MKLNENLKVEYFCTKPKTIGCIRYFLSQSKIEKQFNKFVNTFKTFIA